MDVHSILENCQGFVWDKGNSLKSWLKHHVSQGEAEQTFFNGPLLLVEDEKHSQDENRFRALGYTQDNRHLYIVFMVRDQLIRVISARDMNKKERIIYEDHKTNT